MFSVVYSTISDISDMMPVLQSGSSLAELIIIDSRWSEYRKQQIEDTETKYRQIIYAPPRKQIIKQPYDFLDAHNTGIAYSDGPWVLCMGGKNMFKPDFFERAKETIALRDDIAIRPLDLEPEQGDTIWNSYTRYVHRYIPLPCMPLGKEGLRSILPIITCGFIIMHLKNWFRLNGFDERYDVGCGWYDNDLLDRIYMLGLPVVLDQELMIYRFPHTSAFSREHREQCKQLYFEDKDKKCYAPNPFDLQELHNKSMEQKGQYLIKP